MSNPPDRVKFQGVTPIFSVKDVPKSVDYYVERLGFELAWDYGNPVNFACVCRDAFSLFLCQDLQGAPGTWVYVPVSDVDELHAELDESGATIIQPPTNFAWGSREMNVEDPDGHRIRFASDATGPSDGVPLPE